jgi:hypothetical protein
MGLPYRFDPLFIEDPLALGNNVGRNCFRIVQIQKAWSDAHAALVAAVDAAAAEAADSGHYGNSYNQQHNNINSSSGSGSGMHTHSAQQQQQQHLHQHGSTASLDSHSNATTAAATAVGSTAVQLQPLQLLSALILPFPRAVE